MFTAFSHFLYMLFHPKPIFFPLFLFQLFHRITKTNERRDNPKALGSIFLTHKQMFSCKEVTAK